VKDPAPIVTARLRLIALPPGAVRRLLGGDRAGASGVLGLSLPEEFPAGRDDGFLQVQLRQMEADPGGRGWCVRAMVRKGDSTVIGSCGFHGPPKAVGRAEIGYTVFQTFRSRGYATEAADALIEWARHTGERTIFASVAPTNGPSIAVLKKLGFRHVGEQMDEIEGRELVFELSLQVP
jgi:RimJ/RimL family protein N-acetyltransferase